MNERLKELVKQARLPACHASHPTALERFAELIRADEREACAKFLESTDLSKAGEYTGFIANMLLEYAKAIRVRIEK
jgi:hypothetical protein